LRRNLICLGLLLLLCLSLSPASGKSARPPLEDTREWIGLSRIWRQLTDHWNHKLYSREKFAELGEALSAARPELETLEKRHYFTPEIRAQLEAGFIRRYLFLQGQLYSTATEVNLSDLDQYAYSSQTQIENLLGLLRQPPALPEKESAKILKQAREALAYEVEFFVRAGALKQEIDQRRQEAAKRTGEDKAVDWEQFNAQVLTRTRGLIDDYSRKNLKPGKMARQIRDYFLSLTETPLPPESPGSP
jgi:hypothetical protein